MQIKTLEVGDGRYDVTCPSLLVEQIESFDQLLALVDELGAKHPDERVLMSLDDVHQAGCTSMHATQTHRLDDREGYDLAGVDPAACDFFVLEANFRKKCGAASFDVACARGLTLHEEEMTNLERINEDPAILLDDQVVVRRVPVRESSMVISALPNGYFMGDLDPFENYALAEHLRLHYGYRLFGMGADCIAFRRDQPLDAAMAARLGNDLARLYHCTEEPGKAARFAHIAQRHDSLFLKYTEWFPGHDARRSCRDAGVQEAARGQQLGGRVRRVVLHAGEDVAEVVERVDVARLARGDERVQAGQTLARGDVANEEVVLATESDAPERPLGRIVVERHRRVGEEDTDESARVSATPLQRSHCRRRHCRRRCGRRRSTIRNAGCGPARRSSSSRRSSASARTPFVSGHTRSRRRSR